MRRLLLCGLALCVGSAWGQLPGSVSGSLQLELRSYQRDSLIGASELPQRIACNAYVPVTYRLGNVTLGFRYEAYLPPLQGYDPRYEGNGFPFRFIEYREGHLHATLGSFYEQFGSGILLRAYEERLLGIDNALDGIRVRYTAPGLRVTGLLGRQRRFFGWSGLVRGADLELAPADWGIGFPVDLSLGASVVSKYQRDDDPQFRLPENVLAYALRSEWRWSGWRVYAEWAYKYNDPSALNGFSYNPGTALYTVVSGTLGSLGITLQAKRVDNMAFYSDRTASGTVSVLNYLPPLSRQHTYRLATLYNYATQPGGEIGLSAELITPVPERFGNGMLTLAYSRIHGLDTVHTEAFRYRSRFPGISPRLYLEELVLEHSAEWGETLKSTLELIRLNYNKDVAEGVRGYGYVHAWIAIAELVQRLSRQHSLRVELQHLWSRQDRGNWVFAAAEFALASRWSLSVWSEYNYGNPKRDERFAYPGAALTLIHRALRLSLGYGRQRAGIVCVGGVCRYMPAAHGASLSLTTSF
jgi:hypothetical protein